MFCCPYYLLCDWLLTYGDFTDRSCAILSFHGVYHHNLHWPRRPRCRHCNHDCGICRQLHDDRHCILPHGLLQVWLHCWIYPPSHTHRLYWRRRLVPGCYWLRGLSTHRRQLGVRPCDAEQAHKSRHHSALGHTSRSGRGSRLSPEEDQVDLFPALFYFDDTHCVLYFRLLTRQSEPREPQRIRLDLRGRSKRRAVVVLLYFVQ